MENPLGPSATEPGLGLGSIGSRRRATLSLTDLRTPLVENIMSMLPTGHDKAFKYALYNVVAMILAAVCIAALWAAYCILEPFCKPLLWALLVGSVIHPVKDRLVRFAREWLCMVNESPTPLSLQLAFIPFRTVDSVSESIGSKVFSWWKYIAIGATGFFLTYLIYYNPPEKLLNFLCFLIVFMFQAMLWIISWINGKLVLAMSAVYLGTVLHFVFGRMSVQQHEAATTQTSKPTDQPDQSSKPASDVQDSNQNDLIVRVIAITTWAMWFIYTCRLLPYPLLFLFFLSIFTGSIIYVQKRSAIRNTVPALTKYAVALTILGKSRQSSRGVSRKGSIQSKGRQNTLMSPSPSDSNKQFSTPNESDSLQSHHLPSASDKQATTAEPNNATDPKSPEILGCYSDEALLSPVGSTVSEDEVDGVLDSNKFLYSVLCACLVVQVWHRLWLVHLLPIPVIYFGLKRLGLSFGIFDYFQKTVVQPFVKFYSTQCGPSNDLFPAPVRMLFRIIYEADRKFISMFESYLDMLATIIILVAVVVVSVIILIFAATQFYAEGDHLVRVGANVINSTVSKYPEISKMLPEGWESLTDSLIGNAYHYGRDYIKTWIRDSVSEKDPEKAEEMERQVIELWDRIYLSWNRTWGSLDNLDEEARGVEWNDIVKTSQGVSDWFDSSMLVSYIKSNIGGLRAVVSRCGHASTSVYKPVELFNNWFPGDGKHSMSFVSAIEESVSGVFSATLKMSAFYGMWTWLVHTLFQVNIVFVPSFFAAIFAAVPLLMPYWAAFPAVLELWLIQGQWTKALFMLLAQMLPMSCVDAQIYSEIHGGGHPYLTALAVAGGIFYFGFQGAIMGPVVLCSLFVAVKMGSSYMKEGTVLEFQ
ncbi:Transmembrane protein [Orchesella cincta]|uniref:Transmembrane protein n=1 Tax=Orchesella cincta TaxID=48709 RepID=A0A1D2MLR6_ORCCI|nr:Transmembrane protein [Orchesella cincta]